MDNRQVSHCRFVLWSEATELAGQCIGLDNDKMHEISTEMIENECLWDKSRWHDDKDKLGSAVCYVPIPQKNRERKTGVRSDFVRNKTDDKCTIHILNVTLEDSD